MTDDDAAGWTPVTRTPTYELVLDRIEEQIAAGRLGIGDRLPAERDLAQALGVSRVAVREAMRVLGALGLVQRGTGSGPEAGTFLASAPGEALTRLIRLHVLVASVGSGDLVRARIALERESARLAATNATPADHAVLRGHLAVMDTTDDPEEFNDRDTAFHVAIARAGGNPLVAELTIALRTAMRPTLLARLHVADELAAVTGRLRSEHHEIHRALLEGDGALAAELVERHIEDFYLSGDGDPDAAEPVADAAGTGRAVGR